MPVSLGPGLEPIPGYRLIERLGRGGFGEVWKTEAPGGLQKAIKFVYGDLDATDSSEPADQEFKSLKRIISIRHPYILSLERIDVVDGELRIVMELADRNLWDRYRDCRAKGLSGIPRDELLGYLNEAAEALDMMNFQYQLQHLDIKPQNLFLVYNHIKIADFGLVKAFEGKRGTITGGVTPVYASPETCDGWVSRHSDQYSLAIVFQELLTGQRPFNGSTALQLMMQHSKADPDVSSLPEADRPIIAKALAKKPDDRFPNCRDFVRALQDATTGSARLPLIGNSVPPVESPSTANGVLATPNVANSPTDRMQNGSVGNQVTHPRVPSTQLRRLTVQTHGNAVLEALPLPDQLPEEPAKFQAGVLTPTLVLGLGNAGSRVLGMFRAAMRQQHGPEPLPHLRMLAVDTDPESIRKLTSNSDYPLRPDEVFLAGLNRASHYLKGDNASKIDKWLGTSHLYRLPKKPGAAESRAFGRLALMDHAVTLVRRVRAELDACRNPVALSVAEQRTKLGIRSDRPRIYIVAGLGGGTGGGMFIDVAYFARAILRELGQSSPEVIGVLLLPPAERGVKSKDSGLAQTYASLTELLHFDSDQSVYDLSIKELPATIDRGPPFTRTVLIPMADPDLPSADTALGQASGWLCNEALSYVGPVNELERSLRSAKRRTPRSSMTTAATYRFDCPRGHLCRLAGRRLGIELLQSWLTKTVQPEVSQSVTRALDEAWEFRELSPDGIVNRLHKKVVEVIGGSPTDQADGLLNELATSKEHGHRFDSTAALQALNRIVSLLGSPDDHATGEGQPGRVSAVMDMAGPELSQEVEREVAAVVIKLFEQPGLRMTGAEDAVRQIADRIRQALSTFESLSVTLRAESAESMNKLLAMIPGIDRFALTAKRRDLHVQEVLAVMRDLSRKFYQRQLSNWLQKIYRGVLSGTPEYIREVQYCRERLNQALNLLTNTADGELHRDPVRGPGLDFLPHGTINLAGASHAIVQNLKPADMVAFDAKVQEEIGKHYGTLIAYCLDNGPRPEDFAEMIDATGRAFLEIQLPENDSIATMLAAFENDHEELKEWIEKAIELAHPSLVGPNAAIENLVTVIGVPATPSGKRLQSQIESLTSKQAVVFAESVDTVIVNREFQHLQIRDLPQLGSIGCEAYRNAIQVGQISPHSRFDITWPQVST